MAASSTASSAWSKFSAASATVKAAARRRLRSESSSSNDDNAGVARQLLRESREAGSWAAAKTGIVVSVTTITTKIRVQRRLLKWAELAPWQQPGSERILTGYRAAHASYSTCFYSWTYLHNESVNILSHVFGAVVFIDLAITLWLNTWPWTIPFLHSQDVTSNSTADKLAATTYMFGVIVCFSLSALFHTTMCHSAECAARGMAMDITGVLVLMAGAVVPLVHFGLACESTYVRQAFYMATAVLGTMAAATTWQASEAQAGASPFMSSRFSFSPWRALRALLHMASVQGPANGHRRAALFVSFAAVSCAGPLLWMQQTDPLDWAARVNLWPGVAGTLLFNAIGFLAYTTQFPERRWPRRFDLLGASHQLMHLAVLAAAVTYIVGVHRALAFRRGEGA
ncbi:hypothetical protein Sste5344_006575 [Sporothrix stenoceras]